MGEIHDGEGGGLPRMGEMHDGERGGDYLGREKHTMGREYLCWTIPTYRAGLLAHTPEVAGSNPAPAT